MSVWRQFSRGLRGLLNRPAASQDLHDEVQQYFDEAVAAGMARGLTEQEARHQARLEFGNPGAVQEQVRSSGWENIPRVCVADLRYAARQMRRYPGFALVTVLTLALGIGASTAIFSAVYPILFAPLPYPHAGRILMIWNVYQGARSEISFGTYRELAQRTHSFDAISVFQPWNPALTGRSQAERLDGQAVTADFFRVLGVSPSLGRDFLASEDVFHGPRVVILSDTLWRQRFAGDPGVLGRPIKLDDDNYTVVGVMPAGFENVLSPSARIWTPLQYDTSQLTTHFDSGEWGNHLQLVGRLRPGISRRQATQEMLQIARTPWKEFPRPRWASMQHGLIVESLQDDVAHNVKPALLAILGAVLLLMAIASVNVVNLLLARSAQRRGEFTVRSVLGASHGRIARQLIAESLLLATLGGFVGMVLAAAGVKALIWLSPPGLPRLHAIAVNRPAFLFALGITTVIGLLTGLLPALHLSRAELQPGLQQASRRTVGGHSFTRRALVVTEVALALVLLVSAGLLMRSMQRLLSVDPGFSPAHLLTLQVQTSGHQFDELPSAPGVGDATRRRFFVQALDAVRHLPGVEQAAFTSLLPLSDDPSWISTYGSLFENEHPQSAHNVFRYAVSPGYCATMQIPVLRGRCLEQRDTAGAPPAALISESLARRHFPHLDPLGKRLHVGPTDRPWFIVVGVVPNVKQASLAVDEPDAVYLSTEQTWFADDALSFVIRTRGDAAALAPAVKDAIWSVDKNQPVVRIATMDELLAISEAQRHFVLILFQAFGIAALLLAAVGLYGVISGSVTERTREIGVRAALGASRDDILALVMGQALRLTALGIALGFCAALAASRALITLLFGVSQLDPVTYAGVIALLALVSAIACLTPALRAMRVDPSITLRAE